MRKITQEELDNVLLSNIPLSLTDLDSRKLNFDHFTASITKIDLSGINASGLDFRGAELNNSTFSGSDLSGANLSGCSLFLSSFMSANLSYANLSDTVPGEAMFNQKTNFYKAILPENFHPFLYKKDKGHFFKYSFSLMFGNWYIFNPSGNGVYNLSEIKDDLLLNIILKRIDLLRQSNDGGFYILYDDFQEEILPHIIKHNSLLE